MSQGEQFSDSGQTTCAHCGRSMPAAGRFCPHCGYGVETDARTCRSCGASVRAGASFCPSCGVGIIGDAVHVSSEGRVEHAGLEYIGFWPRFGATVIDAIITGAGSAIIGAITGVPALGSVLSILYYVLLIGLQGQTLGKMVLHIRVIDARGNAPGIGRAILRETLGKLVSAVGLLLGYLWIIWDREKRGWHDYIAGTWVVRK